jgi:hypothetical protein
MKADHKRRMMNMERYGEIYTGLEITLNGVTQTNALDDGLEITLNGVTRSNIIYLSSQLEKIAKYRNIYGYLVD